MGTLIPRKRKDGSTGYTALITLKRDGKITHREAKTFDRRQAANAWMVTRETELRRPGGLERKENPLLAAVSTRRQKEITRIEWADFDKQAGRVLVRDMKHPGDKKGNHVLCDLVPEALALIESMPRTAPQIFPYSTEPISAAFTRACKMLGIEDLHFHDLRHEGVSRLFEMGKSIPRSPACQDIEAGAV